MSVTPDNDSERDATLTAVYRAADQDLPPPALDSAILAAARREVGARPRPVGHGFGHAWRAPLSIAAVIVLSVSLVTLMREEAPELVTPPTANTRGTDSKPEFAGAAADNSAAVDGRFLRDEQRSKSIGLRPPQASSNSGLGIRQSDLVDLGSQAKPKQGAGAERADDTVTGATAPAKRRATIVDVQKEAMQAPATVATAGPAENKLHAKAEAAASDRAEPDSSVRAQSRSAPARQGADALSAPASIVPPAAPAAQPAFVPQPSLAAPQIMPAPPAVAVGTFERSTEITPEKWLERIEDLRKRGRLDEAKSSLAEFRKRYPDYKLPPGLREWAAP
jgi:hypothetical protein